LKKITAKTQYKKNILAHRFPPKKAPKDGKISSK